MGRRDVGEGLAAAERHGPLELVLEDLQHARGAGRAARGEAVDGHPLYGRVAPLLADMNATFGARAAELAARARTAAEGSAVAELADGARLLAGRAAFVAHIYAAQAPDATATAKAAALGGARAALDAAAAVVARRERHYRVDAARVGGWRDTPTAYGFGYLWTVKTLSLIHI